MRVEIWGSQVHVVDLVSGSLLLIVAGFLLWSVWAIRCKGFRRYWGGVSKASVAIVGGSIAIFGAVFQMVGVVGREFVGALGRSGQDWSPPDGPPTHGPDLPHARVIGRSESDKSI